MCSIIMMVLIFLSLIYIFFYKNMVIYLLISMEILNFTILLILVHNISTIHLFLALLIQVGESVILMMLLLENFCSWKNFFTWNLFY